MAAPERAASFDAFVTARAPRLLRVATLLLGDRAAGESALSAELTRAWSRWRPGTADAAEDAVVRGLVAAAGRAAPAAGAAPANRPLPAGIGTSRPEEVAARGALRTALAALPAELRAVVVLRHAEGHPTARVAELLREDPAQVARAEAAALARLAQEPDLAGWVEPTAVGA